jgi:putative iron-regulated protein
MMTNFKPCTLSLLCTAFSGLLFAGCGSEDPQDPTVVPLQQAVATYAQIVRASYEDSHAAALALESSVSDLISNPSEESLAQARQAWLDAREPYLQTEVFRFYDGPIDVLEGGINAWPLDESYIDYTVDDEESGIINDPSVTLDEQTLVSKNEEGGEENIAVGFHAIEFLLWGQDLSETGPGERPFTDYVTEGDDATQNADRRGEYLTAASALLVSDLWAVTQGWAEDDSNYRAEFTAAATTEALRRILTGMIVLSGFETGGERLENAILTGEQNDEHSCFSDNTHRDMVQDVQGVWNVWHGSYERSAGSSVTGVGVRDVVQAKDSALAAKLDAQIAKSLKAAKALRPPFDREIQLDNAAGRARVQALSTALREQEGLLQQVFRAFQLTVPEDPQ